MKILQKLLTALILSTTLARCNDEGIESYSEDDDNTDKSSKDCGIKDGSHSASVDYYNPNTEHSATYDLEVEVEDCQVTTIYFPKGGWLDSDHISPEELDEDGNATLEDENGRTFDVHIDE
jgi:hypothetical protein